MQASSKNQRGHKEHEVNSQSLPTLLVPPTHTTQGILGSYRIVFIFPRFAGGASDLHADVLKGICCPRITVSSKPLIQAVGDRRETNIKEEKV